MLTSYQFGETLNDNSQTGNMPMKIYAARDHTPFPAGAR